MEHERYKQKEEFVPECLKKALMHLKEGSTYLEERLEGECGGR